MNRDVWTFSCTADVLLKAATDKHTWHSGRLDWWTKKKEEVLAEIKAEGLEIDESVALGYSNLAHYLIIGLGDEYPPSHHNQVILRSPQNAPTPAIAHHCA